MRTPIEDSIKYFTAMMKTCQADSEMLSIAIETMRRYQKIEEIIMGYDAAWELHHMKPTIDKIREVLNNDKNLYVIQTAGRKDG